MTLFSLDYQSMEIRMTGLLLSIMELTPKQRKVLKLVEQRKTNKQISQVFGIAERTIEQHLNVIYSALQISGKGYKKRQNLIELLELISGPAYLNTEGKKCE